MVVSLIGEDSSFIVISVGSVCDTTFYFINGICMCSSKVTMNHSLCCTSNIWKLTLAINVLNLWSKSQKYSVGISLISLISIMHHDSNFIFLKSSIIPNQIWLSIFCATLTDTIENFMCQSTL